MFILLTKKKKGKMSENMIEVNFIKGKFNIKDCDSYEYFSKDCCAKTKNDKVILDFKRYSQYAFAKEICKAIANRAEFILTKRDCEMLIKNFSKE